MFRGRHLTRLMTCLLVLLVADCGRQGFEGGGGGGDTQTASVSIVINESPNGGLATTFAGLWFGETDPFPSVDAVDAGDTQAWGEVDSISIPLSGPSVGVFSFPTVNGLQIGLWKFEVNLTLAHLSGTLLGNAPCKVVLIPGNNVITFVEQLSGDQPTLTSQSCSPTTIVYGGPRPKWPPAKR